MESNKTTIWVIIVIVIIIIIGIFAFSGSSTNTTPVEIPPVTEPATSTSTTSVSTTTTSVTTATPAEVDVVMKNFAFNPTPVTINKGQTVVWTNNDSATHNVTGTGWSSGSLSTGQSYAHTFTTAGTYNYSCTIHPTMKGQVIVK